METKNPEEKQHKTATHIFAILGFIVLLMLGIWASVQLVRLVPRLVGGDSNSNTSANATIELLVNDTTLRSGEKFDIGWALSEDQTDGGVLSFAYQCVEGVRFTINGENAQCNEAFVVDDPSTPLTLIPLSSHTTPMEVGVAITFTKADDSNVRDTGTLTITNGSDTNTTETPTDTQQSSQGSTVSTYQPTTTYVQVPRASNPYGTPDLFVSSITLGVINTATGAFEARNHASSFERGAARFSVQNIGDKETGLWRFHATLPTYNSYTYLSDPQASIAPGATAEMTVTFDQLAAGTRSFTVSVDPYNEITERFEQNNSASALFTVTN